MVPPSLVQSSATCRNPHIDSLALWYLANRGLLASKDPSGGEARKRRISPQHAVPMRQLYLNGQIDPTLVRSFAWVEAGLPSQCTIWPILKLPVSLAFA